MNRIATFEKVSLKEYMTACKKQFGDDIDEDKIRQEWENIKLPTRATYGSAGYDFFIPRGMTFNPGNHVFFPTGIRCRIDEGWVLICCPKSGLGSRYNMRLTNTIGVIDSDYYRSDNEGHIMAGFCVSKTLTLEAGDKFMQGLFIPFGITTTDGNDGNSLTERNGGFGSTGRG